jgi:hypothetical protein
MIRLPLLNEELKMVVSIFYETKWLPGLHSQYLNKKT